MIYTADTFADKDLPEDSFDLFDHMASLAYNNRWTMEPTEKFIGQKITHARFSGH